MSQHMIEDNIGATIEQITYYFKKHTTCREVNTQEA